MKKILVYYSNNKFSMTDFYGTDYKKIPEIVKKEYSGKFPNVGNKVWLQALVSEISDGQNQYEFGYEELSEDFINENYDCVLLPLANCFHRGWIEYMKRRAEHIRKLKIPVYVIACGIQADSYDDLDSLVDEIKEPATELISSVYNTGGEFALRGYFTAEFFKRLGFNNAVVTGCPSLYQMGRELAISNSKVSENNFIAAINGSFHLPVDEHSINSAFFVDQGNFGNMLFDPTYFHNHTMNIRRILKYAKRKDLCELNAIADKRIKLFESTQEWISFFTKNNISFSFGSRIHGTVMPILAGVPSLLYSCDARTREMAEFFNIPFIDKNQIKTNDKIKHLYDLYCSVDYSKFNTNFGKLFDSYEHFLKKCGLVTNINSNNIFMTRSADIPLPQSPNEKEFDRIKFKTKMLSPVIKALAK